MKQVKELGRLPVVNFAAGGGKIRDSARHEIKHSLSHRLFFDDAPVFPVCLAVVGGEKWG